MRNGTIVAESVFIIGIRHDGSCVRFGSGRDAETAILDGAAEADHAARTQAPYAAIEVRDHTGKVLAAWDGPEFQFRSNLNIDDLWSGE